MSSLSGLVTNTIVPNLFKVVEQQEPQIESAIVNNLMKVRISNPTEFNTFIDNWRKINLAVEKSTSMQAGAGFSDWVDKVKNALAITSTPPPMEPVLPTTETPTAPSTTETTTAPAITEPPPVSSEPIPSTPVEPPTEADVGGKKKSHRKKTVKQNKKRTHRIKRRKH